MPKFNFKIFSLNLLLKNLETSEAMSQENAVYLSVVGHKGIWIYFSFWYMLASTYLGKDKQSHLIKPDWCLCFSCKQLVFSLYYLWPCFTVWHPQAWVRFQNGFCVVRLLKFNEHLFKCLVHEHNVSHDFVPLARKLLPGNLGDSLHQEILT